MTSGRASLIWLYLLLSIVTTARIAAGADGGMGDGHVRSTDHALMRLFDRGETGSETFRMLVDRIRRSDIVVYLDCDVFHPPMLGGRISFLTQAADWRYVRVRIDCRQTPLAQLRLLGHELRHAVEIADAADVVDQPSMRDSMRGSVSRALWVWISPSTASRQSTRVTASRKSSSRAAGKLTSSERPIGSDEVNEL